MGRWVEIVRPWHDTSLTHCTACGRLVPRSVWMAEVAGRERPFCDVECEELYRNYVLPRYGNPDARQATAPDSGADTGPRDA